jgi:hypothetical protein
MVLSLAMKNYFTRTCAINATALVLLFAAGCSKSPDRETAEDKKLRKELSIPASMPVKDLGVVELSANIPKRISLGEGREFIITPIVLSNDVLMVHMFVETKKAGNLTERSQSQLMAKSGQQCALSVGNLMIGITPMLKKE